MKERTRSASRTEESVTQDSNVEEDLIMTLSGKVALVTGGTGALGSTIVKRLNAEGCTVFATSHRDSKARLNSMAVPSKLRVIQADVTDEQQVQSLFESILDESAHIDIVINTVGGYVPGKPLKEVTVRDWDLMMNINLRSAFLTTREAIRKMESQTYGRIINISAMAGLNPRPGRAPYTISKAGVSLLTEIVAQEVKGTGITVNAIAPSIILTAANQESMPNEDTTNWVKPEQIVELILYLCSASAGAVTGTTIKAFGGV